MDKQTDKAPDPLSFDELRRANLIRNSTDFHEDDWQLNDWATALAGETGELCNLLKKLKRGDTEITRKMLANELADVICYADLLASRLPVDLGKAVRDKFNAVSVRVGSTVKLKIPSPATPTTA